MNTKHGFLTPYVDPKGGFVSAKENRLAGCHAHLRAIYASYPLARLLVESAGSLEQAPGHHFMSVRWAYQDWLLAVFEHIDRPFLETLWVICQIIPPSHAETSGYQFNPVLPGLPPRPVQDGPYRSEAMRSTLENIDNNMQERKRKRTHG